MKTREGERGGGRGGGGKRAYICKRTKLPEMLAMNLNSVLTIRTFASSGGGAEDDPVKAKTCLFQTLFLSMVNIITKNLNIIEVQVGTYCRCGAGGWVVFL